MTKISSSKLRALYEANEIAIVWNESQNLPVIDHPQYGSISPNKYRAMHGGKPCPYCGLKMAHGKEIHSTSSKQEAIKRGYEYVDKRGKKVINSANSIYFHPNYVTLDHKINKARCPEKMFDYSNLQTMCWRCNKDKGDDNTFELQHTYEYLDTLADEALARYQLL
jgi:5-methylcytosine-specific restriction endonuclease McrA